MTGLFTSDVNTGQFGVNMGKLLNSAQNGTTDQFKLEVYSAAPDYYPIALSTGDTTVKLLNKID